MVLVSGAGRLCNHVIRYICASMLARKHGLSLSYGMQDKMNRLGIKTYSGDKIYNNCVKVTDDNFIDTLSKESFTYTIDMDYSFFQTNEIIQLVYNYLNEETHKFKVKDANRFKERFGNNNDCFIHVRLTDTVAIIPNLEYFLDVLKGISFDNIYIGTDDKNHKLITELKLNFPNATVVDYDEVDTIHFGSTCKYVVLTHGSFSACIGYLAYDSIVYAPSWDYEKKNRANWHGNMMSIKGWTIVDSKNYF